MRGLGLDAAPGQAGLAACCRPECYKHAVRQPEASRRPATRISSAHVSPPSVARRNDAGHSDGKMGAKKIVHVATNAAAFGPEGKEPTGLWLSELTHAWDVFAAHGYEQEVVSPKGGKVPLDPRSLGWLGLDASAKAWLDAVDKMALLETTRPVSAVDPAGVDAIYLAGGHGTMVDFTGCPDLDALVARIWEQGGVVSSVCHGYCGLLTVQVDGAPLIKGRHVTGFSFLEERLAGVAGTVPYNAQARAQEQGAVYDKCWVPFRSKTSVDGRLVTGQNPQSAHATAERVVALLEG